MTATEHLASVNRASAHFDAACKAVLAHDDDAFKRHMAEFRAIQSTWAIQAANKASTLNRDGSAAEKAAPGKS